jgi:hypothetical protein
MSTVKGEVVKAIADMRECLTSARSPHASFETPKYLIPHCIIMKRATECPVPPPVPLRSEIEEEINALQLLPPSNSIEAITSPKIRGIKTC